MHLPIESWHIAISMLTLSTCKIEVNIHGAAVHICSRLLSSFSFPLIRFCGTNSYFIDRQEAELGEEKLKDPRTLRENILCRKQPPEIGCTVQIWKRHSKICWVLPMVASGQGLKIVSHCLKWIKIKFTYIFSEHNSVGEYFVQNSAARNGMYSDQHCTGIYCTAPTNNKSEEKR